MSEPSKPSLSNHRYGGHSAVSDDHSKVEYEQAMPAHLDNSPTPPYDARGGNEPAGVERHGMYGTAPAGGPSAPPADRTRPLPGPASLGQYDNDDMRPVAPLGDAQQREVLDERLAAYVDPGTVKVELDDHVCVLRGRVRDAETKARIGHIAESTLPGREIRNALEIGGPA
ncbi:BON domain-containing protein [Cupriavidus sp. H18C2]|uniref:BON domain-containing protein n=1 Tax=Cupriavidus sp. H18C2 TaxID=3241602 RepID=UPI003BF7ECCD